MVDSDAVPLLDENPREHAFLPLRFVERWVKAAKEENIAEARKGNASFLAAYRRAKGRPERLTENWHEARERFLKKEIAAIKLSGEHLFDRKGRPTRRHLSMILWAFSPRAALLQAYWRNPAESSIALFENPFPSFGRRGSMEPKAVVLLRFAYFAKDRAEHVLDLARRDLEEIGARVSLHEEDDGEIEVIARVSDTASEKVVQMWARGFTAGRL